MLKALLLALLSIASYGLTGQGIPSDQEVFDPTQSWVFWYWNDAAVSKAGITADLEAMKQQGLGGAYLFFIRGVSDSPKFSPPAVQFTDHWWELVRFAFAEAKRLDLKLGLHACDGFATAGGPWISPEESMKKLVWADTLVEGPERWTARLPQPETVEGFYEDVKTFAYRVEPAQLLTNYTLKPKLSTSIPAADVSWLNDPRVTVQRLRSKEPCWLQYEFAESFTCRSITLKGGGNNFQTNRLILETSDDGAHFTFHTRLQAHRQGWMDGQFETTHTIPPVSARYFRFRYDPKGSEPGSEDLDAAKWRPSFKVSGLELSAATKIHQFEGKNGSVWRIAQHTDAKWMANEQILQASDLIDLTSKVDSTGQLNWDIPPGYWRIRRIGFTSTGKTNYIGGGAVGLECDKFDSTIAAKQFDQWLGAFYREIPEELLTETLAIFHLDSWECGSQNWSRVFAEEFQRRRGYDLMPHLLVMTGVPLQSTEFSEQVLLDVRETIGELVADNFFGTFKQLAADKGLQFSAESIAPTMVGDGMRHHGIVDIPMGEFWYNSPTHDKPNDILDAISGGHLYGKQIIQAESFTEIRIDWDEHPAKLKRTLDRNYGLGINRIVPHVWSHNPWVDRKPGMTLGVVGLFYQPTQTWFQTGGKAWMDYIHNCQKWLQKGQAVVDVAVFTGEAMPRRAILPDRLVQILPGIFGDSIVNKEMARSNQVSIPIQERPRGVFSQANMANPENWVNPLNGYAYDSFNKDALLRLSSVVDGRVVLPGGASYAILVIPGSRKMMPEGGKMSLPVTRKILELVHAGACVYIEERPTDLLGFADAFAKAEFDQLINTLFAGAKGDSLSIYELGRGKVITGQFTASSFAFLDIERDLQVKDVEQSVIRSIAWNHRITKDQDVYFLANQSYTLGEFVLSFRVSDKVPSLYFPTQDRTISCQKWTQREGRIEVPLRLQANESCFVVFSDAPNVEQAFQQNWPTYSLAQELEGSWQVQFDTAYGGPSEPVLFEQLTDWTTHPLDGVKYYSGTATYSKSFEWSPTANAESQYVLSLGTVHNIAKVKLNGKECGVAWTTPYQVDITEYLQVGPNLLEIELTNTWANRLIGDHQLAEKDRISWTTAAYRLEGKDLLPAGLLGPVEIWEER